MAIATGVRDSIDLKLAPMPKATRIEGDQVISEQTIKQVALFLLKEYSKIFNVDQTRELRALTIAPLSLEEVQFGLQLIEKVPFIQVGSDELNRTPSGHHLLTREMEVSYNRKSSTVVLTPSFLTGLESNRELAKVKMINIPQKGFDIIKRWAKSLEDSEKKEKIIVVVGGFSTPRPVPKDWKDVPIAFPVGEPCAGSSTPLLRHSKRSDDACCDSCTVA